MRKRILKRSKKNLNDEDALIFPISAITRKGLDELAIMRLRIYLKRHRNSRCMKLKTKKKRIQFCTNMKREAADFEITRDDDGAFVLSGYTIERLFKMTDFNFDQSVRKFARQMRGMGVDDALRERGAKDGDTVRLLEFEFEFLRIISGNELRRHDTMLCTKGGYPMKQLGEGHFYLVREDVLTESMLKMLEAKRLLASGEESTIQDATKRVGLSRSAFYKYRDTVFPFESIARERILTIFIQLEDRKGSLATLLQIVSEAKCNVLTIHQTIPVQARANITLSLDVTEMTIKMEEFLQRLKVPDFVDSVVLISSGAL